MAIDVFIDSQAPGLPAAEQFEPWVRAALTAAGVASDDAAISVCLRVVDEAEGRELNRVYRQKDYATNVLSFAGEVEVPGCRHIGDVVICAPIVEGESRQQGKSLAAHYAHLSIHGALHLLGFDHQVDEEAEHMESLEVAALSQLGLADPYQPTGELPGSTVHQEACSNG